MDSTTNPAKGTVLLLCGKICSGKSHYAARLLARRRAVLLSCDEMMLALGLDELLRPLGDAHRLAAPQIKTYLYGKAVEIARAGADAVLDFGFWSRAERAEVRAYFAAQGVPCEWHYLDVSDADWARNIAQRAAEGAPYPLDDGLMAKLRREFEPPAREEIDVWVRNARTDA